MTSLITQRDLGHPGARILEVCWWTYSFLREFTGLATVGCNHQIVPEEYNYSIGCFLNFVASIMDRNTHFRI
jgi:hypothetical protein